MKKAAEAEAVLDALRHIEIVHGEKEKPAEPVEDPDVLEARAMWDALDEIFP